MGASIKRLPNGDAEFRESFHVGDLIYAGALSGGVLVLVGLFATPVIGWIRVVLVVVGLTLGLLAAFNALRSRVVVSDTDIRIYFLFFRTRQVAIDDIESIDPRRGGFTPTPDIWTKNGERIRTWPFAATMGAQMIRSRAAIMLAEHIGVRDPKDKCPMPGRPGWYPDPQRKRDWRYWDGTNWGQGLTH